MKRGPHRGDAARDPNPDPNDPARAAGDPDPGEDVKDSNNVPEEIEIVEAAPAGEEVTRAGQDAAAFQDRWLRAEADLQNLRRRAAKEREEARRFAEEAVMLDLIGLLDDLERALEAARKGGAQAAWLEGVELVAARMRDTLARRGVEVIEPLGQPFDPAYHEALLEVPATKEIAPGRVAQVILKGYRRDARALRAARVVVARAPGAGEAPGRDEG